MSIKTEGNTMTLCLGPTAGGEEYPYFKVTQHGGAISINDSKVLITNIAHARLLVEEISSAIMLAAFNDGGLK
jgi:hypothetical protein